MPEEEEKNKQENREE